MNKIFYPGATEPLIAQISFLSLLKMNTTSSLKQHMCYIVCIYSFALVCTKIRT